METPKEYYYTYYSYEEWGRGYIGSRGCKCLPEEDIKYFGSYSDKTFHPTQKIILAIYKTREEAITDEIILQQYYKVVENPHFANRAYQTSIKFYVSTKQAIENGKKLVEHKVGIHGLNTEQIKQNGKKGALVAKELGVGLYSISPEKRIKNAKKAGKVGGNKTKLLKIGIHGLTDEERRKNGIKAGLKNKQNKIGICGLTNEQRSTNGRKGGKIGGSAGGKITSSQKWICTETGFVANAGNLTKYQKKRGIDTSKRKRIQ